MNEGFPLGYNLVSLQPHMQQRGRERAREREREREKEGEGGRWAQCHFTGSPWDKVHRTVSIKLALDELFFSAVHTSYHRYIPL